MSFERNHSRQERCRPGCSEMRGIQSGFSRRKPSSPLRTTTTSPGSTFTPARRSASSSSRGRHRIAHRHVALLAPRRDVEEDAARGDAALEDRVDRAPERALGGQAVRERPAVVELAVPAHVAERVDVGDPEAVVDHVEAVEHHVHPLALGRERHVVHVHGPRDHVARERDGAALLDQPLRLRLLGGRDQVHRAELVVVPPAAPVVQLLEVPLDAVAGGQGGIGHGSDPFRGG